MVIDYNKCMIKHTPTNFSHLTNSIYLQPINYIEQNILTMLKATKRNTCIFVYNQQKETISHSHYVSPFISFKLKFPNR